MIFTYDVATPSAPALVQRYRALHRLGLPLPPGVFIDEAASLAGAIEALEKQSGKRFGETLFVHAQTEKGDIPYLGLGVPKKDGAAFAQLVAGYLRSVHGIAEESLDAFFDDDITEDAVIIDSAQKRYAEIAGQPFPTKPSVQLEAAVAALLKEGAVLLRVQLQTQAGEHAGVGFATSRDPVTGEPRLTGGYLAHGQPSELLTHRRSPASISKTARSENALETTEPKAFEALQRIAKDLEAQTKDAQYIRFAIEAGQLFVLEAEAQKRSARAAVRIVTDLVEEHIIEKRDALLRTTPEQLEQLIHPNIAPKAKRRVIAKGLPASPGAGSGVVVFSGEEAQAVARTGRKVIFVRTSTAPEDIAGVTVSQGILTSRGGMTSHAAVVARGMGKCCVVGCTEIRIDYQAKTFSTDELTVKEGDIITLDGGTGEVILGEIETLVPELGEDFDKLLAWADEYKRLGVRANANTLQDAEVAARFGASGIGLCRTEQLLLQPDRLKVWREVLLAGNVTERKQMLLQLLPMHTHDLHAIFERMAPHPVTVRLLDPPLEEFLPEREDELLELAKAHGLIGRSLKLRQEALHEVNPMLGHRGCRVAVTYPEIYEMQVRAVIDAACRVAERGIAFTPEIMFPMVSSTEELEFVRRLTDRVAAATMSERGRTIAYRIGTMIEVPRAVWLAGDIARHTDFFSFGTNDLTQTTFGISRDDAGKFLSAYLEQGLLKADPFVTIDRQCVGELVERACVAGRAASKNLQLGLCGEHGGDPASIAFCHHIGIDYVSCSPYRVPVAKLAAAHAALGGAS